MRAPIRIHERYLGAKAKGQNKTARYIWPRLRRWGSFVLADAVGTGKSYVALSLALGLFKPRPRRPFRILVLAGPVELSNSWMLKLAGQKQPRVDVGELARV